MDRTFVAPTVLFPVTEDMRIYHEEQFGPLVPIREWEDKEEVFDYLSASPYGQQVSIFAENQATIGPMIDVLVNQVCVCVCVFIMEKGRKKCKNRGKMKRKRNRKVCVCVCVCVCTVSATMLSEFFPHSLCFAFPTFRSHVSI